MIKKDVVLLIFAKTPIPGEVKTRLIPGLGEAKAAETYVSLLLHSLEVARRSSINNLELWCSPTIACQLLEQYAGDFMLTLKTQSGMDLGERMFRAIEQTLQHCNKVLLIGSDCPQLSEFDLELASKKLTEGHDVILGPPYDGGYYLIGLTKAHPQLFDDIQWGTDKVFQETRGRVKQLGLKLFELDKKHDIDRLEDLQYMKMPSVS